MKPELIEFITSKTHLKNDEIKPETRLAEDIGFYGIDAISFFEEFFEKFEIENRDEFDIDLYIDGSVDFKPSLKHWIRNILIKKRRVYMRPDVAMGHLNNVINRGKWFNEK